MESTHAGFLGWGRRRAFFFSIIRASRRRLSSALAAGIEAKPTSRSDGVQVPGFQPETADASALGTHAPDAVGMAPAQMGAAAQVQDGGDLPRMGGRAWASWRWQSSVSLAASEAAAAHARPAG